MKTILLFALAGTAMAQTSTSIGSRTATANAIFDWSLGSTIPSVRLFAALGTAVGQANKVYLVPDCATTACSAGGGTLRAFKVSDGSTWNTISGGASLCGISGDFQMLDPLTGVGCQPAGIRQDGRNGSVNATMNAQSTLNWQTASVPTFNAGGTTTCDYSASNACWVKFVGGDTTLGVLNGGNGPLLLITRADNTTRAFTATPGTSIGIAGPPNEANKDQFQWIYYTGSGGYQGGPISCPACTPSVYLPGSTSGALTLKAAAVAGTNTLTFPAGTTDFSATGGTSQFVKQASAGGALTLVRPTCADLSDAGAGCTGSGGGNYASSQGNTGNKAMTGSDVVMWTFSSVTMPSGTCLTIEYVLQNAAAGGNSHAKLIVDGTTTAIDFGGSIGQDTVQLSRVKWCNDASSTAAQHYMPLGGGGYISAANYTVAFSFLDYFYISPGTTAIDWSTSHTLTITENQASGNAVGLTASITNF